MLTQLILRHARNKGARAAATEAGNDKPEKRNPYPEIGDYAALHHEWETGWQHGLISHAAKFDQGGHNMAPPHPCARRPEKVCACCPGCTDSCRPTLAYIGIEATEIVMRYARRKLVGR